MNGVRTHEAMQTPSAMFWSFHLFYNSDYYLLSAYCVLCPFNGPTK